MKILSGKSIFSGTALGKIRVIKRAARIFGEHTVTDAKAEMERVFTAIELAKKQLTMLYDKALKEAGKESAGIFELHKMLLEDGNYMDMLRDLILNQHKNAEYAVDTTGRAFANVLSAMEDEYLRARSADVIDISNRLLNCLNYSEKLDDENIGPAIFLADDLSPSEMMQIKKDSILAFATINGSPTSHTAILARMMNIPALMGVDMVLDEIREGSMAIVDGAAGQLILEPTKEQQRAALCAIQAEKEAAVLLQEQKGQVSMTKSGRKVKLFANIGNVSDIPDVLSNDAEGIGLFRSEFLYIGKDTYPTEEEQYQAYSEVLKKLGDKNVVIRTLDIGADKKADYFDFDKEENPALGYRAIRICLKQPEIFKVQLRALLRAAVHGNLSIMYPMITSVGEVKKIKQIVQETADELVQEKIPCRIPEQGIMIETPAAVMISDELAALADFFSIGTNDLTQYTLAVDRQNSKLDEFFDPHHPAILSMIEMTANNAHKHGIRIGICGELSADLSLTEKFLQMGIDELSAVPSMILKLRETVRNLD